MNFALLVVVVVCIDNVKSGGTYGRYSTNFNSGYSDYGDDYDGYSMRRGGLGMRYGGLGNLGYDGLSGYRFARSFLGGNANGGYSNHGFYGNYHLNGLLHSYNMYNSRYDDRFGADRFGVDRFGASHFGNHFGYPFANRLDTIHDKYSISREHKKYKRGGFGGFDNKYSNGLVNEYAENNRDFHFQPYDMFENYYGYDRHNYDRYNYGGSTYNRAHYPNTNRNSFNSYTNKYTKKQRRNSFASNFWINEVILIKFSFNKNLKNNKHFYFIWLNIFININGLFLQ